ncbi:hypothetical protein BDV36DRAFT_294975 [Aspergillus pseudocaelatus]|uniref:DUF7136 domain-containing protein n=1 Tax=Aspergillus pseudocaelatus TaxID=1825620 RepID=A0ABQ6WN54_9EURO|nr:hypothetical protein BDV36DRAFT_294975 [Aspergillus pseudocaelatus]
MLPHGFTLLLPLMAGGAAAANNNNTNNTNIAGPDGVMEFDLVFPRNETYAPTQYFPLVLTARNSSAAWPSGMILSMTIWPDNEDTPPWNSRFNFPAKGYTSGAPPSEPYFAIAGTNLTNGTGGGFTVIWSVVLQETCREDDSNTESFSSGEYNVRFTTKLDAPLPNIEEAASACSESSLALTPRAWLREGACPVLDSDSVTPAAAEPCGLKPLAQELATNVSAAMLDLMKCSEGTWQTIQQPCPAKEENIAGMPRWRSGPGLVWVATLTAVASLL